MAPAEDTRDTQKETGIRQRDRQTEPGLVSLYGIQRGHVSGPFFDAWSSHGTARSRQKIEGLRERTEYIDIFLFSAYHSIVLFPMLCLLEEGECQILVF